MATIAQLQADALDNLQDWFLGIVSYSPAGLFIRFSSDATNWVEVTGTNYAAYDITSGWTYPPTLGYWGWSGSVRFKIESDWTLPRAAAIWDHPTGGHLIAKMSSNFSNSSPFIAEIGKSYCINSIVITNFYGTTLYDTSSAQNQQYIVPNKIFNHMRGIATYNPGPVTIKALDGATPFWTQQILPPDLTKDSGSFFIFSGATNPFYYTNPSRIIVSETTNNSPSAYAYDNEGNIIGRVSLNICVKDIVNSTAYIANSGLVVKIF